MKRYHLSVGHDSFSYSSDKKKAYDLKSRLQISGKLKSRCNADLPPLPPPPSFLPSLYVFPALEWCAAIQVQQGESWLVSARNASGTQELFQFASLSLERTKIHFFRFLKNWKLWNHLFLNHFDWFLRLWFVLFTLKGILFCTLSLCWGIFDCLIFNNYSSSPNGLLTQSPGGREE